MNEAEKTFVVCPPGVKQGNGFKDLTGKKFARLTVASQAPTIALKNGKRKVMWNCLCECGGSAVVASADLNGGHTKSCGCWKRDVTIERNTTHGHASRGEKTNEYTIYRSMIQRCSDPNKKCYPRYGGRGISVCPRWRESFENFLSDMGPRPKGMSIERKENSGNYEPDNCVWATAKEQCRNRRSNVRLEINGRIMTMIEWSEESGIGIGTIWNRVRLGWNPHDAVFRPTSERYVKR